MRTDSRRLALVFPWFGSGLAMMIGVLRVVCRVQRIIMLIWVIRVVYKVQEIMENPKRKCKMNYETPW